MNLLSRFARCWRDLLVMASPARCLLCHRRLLPETRYVCMSCLSQVELTGIYGEAGNVVERVFWHRVQVERAAAWMKYVPDGRGGELLQALKYRGKSGLGRILGQMMANDLAAHGFFRDIDVILPVPLHPLKENLRGYNQSRELAAGVAEVTGLPVNTTALARRVNTPTQTHLSADERWENVKGAFEVVQPEELAGRHVLLLDDVLTTGSTSLACIKALEASDVLVASHTRWSVLALALAGKHHNATKNYRPWSPYAPSLQETVTGPFGDEGGRDGCP